jgi:hypothetical protein
LDAFSSLTSPPLSCLSWLIVGTFLC